MRSPNIPKFSICHASHRVTIVVMPTYGAGGTAIPDKFDAYLGTQLLVCGSRRPFLDGCRELLRLGFDPATMVVMKHVASDTDTDSLRGKIGLAAGLTIAERDRGGPRPRALEGPPSVRGGAVYRVWRAGLCRRP